MCHKRSSGRITDERGYFLKGSFKNVIIWDFIKGGGWALRVGFPLTRLFCPLPRVLGYISL
jgi:hypothetical protein